jgi:hypothetical protein
VSKGLAKLVHLGKINKIQFRMVKDMSAIIYILTVIFVAYVVYKVVIEQEKGA